MVNSIINIIGTSDCNNYCINPLHTKLLDNADIIVGSPRHIELVKNKTSNLNIVSYPTPFSKTSEILLGKNYKNVVFLATGDPCWFGATNFINKKFSSEFEIVSHPNVGSFSLMANKLKIQLQNCICTTIHGRNKHQFIKYINNGVDLMLLSDNSNSYVDVCEILNSRGFEKSKITVFEHLGGEKEKETSFESIDYKNITANFAELNCIHIKINGKKINNKVGIDENEFFHDGQITKSDIRAITVANLSPLCGASMLDLGAGSGSVSIEFMNMGGIATCVEKNINRCENILQNSLHFGHPSLKIENSTIEEYLQKTTQTFDSIFIGGGSSCKKNIIDAINILNDDGVIVVNCVTIESQQIIMELYQQIGGSLQKFSSQKLKQIQNFQVWEKSHELIQFVYKKDNK